MVNGPATSFGPPPAAHNRASSSRDTASSWRMLCQRNDLNQVPTVEGARVALNRGLRPDLGR